MEATKRILIVEDDLNLVLALYRALSHTYKVDTAKTAASGLRKARSLPLDLIILDLNLPDCSGLKITRRLREEGINTPVLVLSGDSSLVSKVDLLDSGANDYVTKPFSLAELRARIRVFMRRDISPVRGVLVSGELELNPSTLRITVNGQELTLRKKEFLILECLVRNAGSGVDRDYLRTYVWGNDKTVSNNSLDVHVKSLRDQLKLVGLSNLIATVHGLGYMYDAKKPKVRV